MKATLEFDLQEEKRELMKALKGADCYSVLYDIGQELFRPARKHGYSGGDLNKINGYLEGEHSEMVHDIIHLLETAFYNILTENNINLDDIE
jgi:hypothetical protein